MILNAYRPGILEVYYGPMKSGKSEHIISRVEHLGFGQSPVKYVAFKPEFDTRDAGIIRTRANGGKSIPAIVLPDNASYNAFDYIDDSIKVVVFDEAQFFSKGLIGVVETLLDKKKNVIVAGPNLDYKAEPFGQMSYFINHADIAVQLYANCEHVDVDLYGNVTECSRKATITQMLVKGQPAQYDSNYREVGDSVGTHNSSISYSPKCREHFILPGSPIVKLKNEFSELMKSR
jgi:thymidine kinase